MSTKSTSKFWKKFINKKSKDSRPSSIISKATTTGGQENDQYTSSLHRLSAIQPKPDDSAKPKVQPKKSKASMLSMDAQHTNASHGEVIQQKNHVPLISDNPNGLAPNHPPASLPLPQPDTPPVQTQLQENKIEGTSGPVADLPEPTPPVQDEVHSTPRSPVAIDQQSSPTVPLSLTSPTSLSDKDKRIRELEIALTTERSINRVLQGQKEAIAKDLDYFSLTVDELMEEKETLLQKYEEEKAMVESKEQDLNVLLDKLKSSADSARDRSSELEQLKLDLDAQKLQVTQVLGDLEQQQALVRDLKLELDTQKMKSSKDTARYEVSLQLKDDQIHQMETDLEAAHHYIERLESQLQRMEDGIKGSSTVNVASTIETPNASPRLAPMTDDRNPSTPVPADRLRIQTLDDQLKKLLQEKERLQSDYSKMPLSGGGPMSRMRCEELEEQLGQVDSRISKVRQQIRKI
ncbi:hypothetical protein DM01DRAFT_1336163 [Hesseltinella vesiculosa]|uniref:Enkurin domain-containing protein n=1 Tax=Hesseltinella vesiculosa TaxID=101127 RepID=A0A1X2GHA2_9FUNG|nr:hypothetical protein DM01DRAFT_1336163 [Hesseltinella vesiculosa]